VESSRGEERSRPELNERRMLWADTKIGVAHVGDACGKWTVDLPRLPGALVSQVLTSSSDSGALKNECLASVDTILTSKQDARMSKLLKMLFGCCTHDRYSFPMNARPGQRRSEAARMTGIYVVCLDCGREFAYSWDEMKVVSANPVSAACGRTVPPQRQLGNIVRRGLQPAERT